GGHGRGGAAGAVDAARAGRTCCGDPGGPRRRPPGGGLVPGRRAAGKARGRQGGLSHRRRRALRARGMSATPTPSGVQGKLASTRKLAALAVAILGLVLPGTAAAIVRTPSGWIVNPVGTQLLVTPAGGGFQGPLGTALSA